MSYCTRDEVLARMGHADATNPDLLSIIDDAIPAAKLLVDNDTGRTFSSVTETRTFKSHGYTALLSLPDFTAITALRLDDDDDGVFEVTVPATDYELDRVIDRPGWPFDQVLLLDRPFPYGGKRRKRIEIAGTWGWAAVPAPINQACSLMAARLAQRTKSALFGVQSFGELGASVIRSNDPDYANLIAPYRVPQVW